MILMILNSLLAVLGIISIFYAKAVSGILAIPCGLIGGITIYSRYMAWKTGAAQVEFEMVKDSDVASRMMWRREIFCWAIGIMNIGIFLYYLG